MDLKHNGLYPLLSQKKEKGVSANGGTFMTCQKEGLNVCLIVSFFYRTFSFSAEISSTSNANIKITPNLEEMLR